MTKEALKLALEALETPWNAPYVDGCDLALGKKVKAITAIKEALANEALDKMAENARELGLDYEPEQEPVGQLCEEAYGRGQVMWFNKPIDGSYVYTTPPQRKEPEQEPVAFEDWHKANYVQNLEKYCDTYKNNHVRCRHQGWLGAQSIKSQRTWVGLTDKEIRLQWSEFWEAECHPWAIDFAKAIEAKLKEKNNG